MPNLHRRQFFFHTASMALAASTVGLRSTTARGAEPRRFGVGFSLYGMKSLALADALRTCVEIGYDCVELPVMTDWPLDTGRLDDASRKNVTQMLREHRLRCSALMENLPLLVGADAQIAQERRLTAAVRWARELAGERPPIVETILGGKPAEWPEVKQRMRERLEVWADIGRRHEVVLAIKPHVAGALHTPDDAVWLVEQVGSPWIRVAFDFSHYQLRGLELGSCLDRLLPLTSFIHVKDAQGTAEKFQFLLPGAGTIDYADYFRRLRAANYRGDVVVEVSGQLHSRADYDPVAAAKTSFRALAEA